MSERTRDPIEQKIADVDKLLMELQRRKLSPMKILERAVRRYDKSRAKVSHGENTSLSGVR